MLLAQLTQQRLGIYALDSVCNAIVLNKILYALPVYLGYLTEGHKDTFRRVVKRPIAWALPFTDMTWTTEPVERYIS